MTSELLTSRSSVSDRSDEPAFAAADRVVPTLRLLADPARMRILQLLRGGERNVSRLCEDLGLSQPTVSHHLGLLRSAGLLQTRRAGKEVHYSLDARHAKVEAGDRRLRIVTDGLEVYVQAAAEAPASTAISA